jgi:hypothetical protein
MGCGAIKKKIPSEESNKILKTTGVPEYDSLFAKCEDALELIRRYKSRLQEAREDFIERLGA